MTREEMRIEVMAGRMKWPESGEAPALAVDARNTRPDLGPTKSWASQGDVKRGPTTFRDGRAIPEWVLAAEKADGVPRVFVRRGGFAGWVKPGPTEKPAEVQAFEKRSGQEWGWDYGRSMWRPVLDFRQHMPTEMLIQADKLFPDPADVRRPVYDAESDTWDWPKLDAGQGKGFGEPVQRPDLNGLDYWADQAQFGIVRPGGGVEKYGARQSDDGAGSLHDQRNSMTAEQAAGKGGAA